MTFDDLDFKNLFVAAQAIKMVALAVEALGKPEYAPGISALRQLAGDLFDRGVMQAQREGIKPRPLKAVQAALAKATKKLVN